MTLPQRRIDCLVQAYEIGSSINETSRMVGVSPGTVSRYFRRFKRQGLSRVRRIRRRGPTLWQTSQPYRGPLWVGTPITGPDRPDGSGNWIG